MRERPILFQGAMVRAIHAGTKTQTRRVVKPQPADHAMLPSNWDAVMRRRKEPDYLGGDGLTWGSVPMADGTWGEVRCPYGQPGDRLWVREAFNRTNPGGDDGVYYYRADDSFPDCIGGRAYVGDEQWKPSIHMPRAACRLVLEVTEVRVERLQAISEADARAEGCEGHRMDDDPFRDFEPVDEYRNLWESINGPGSWDTNPWVWAVSFRRRLP